MVGVVDRMLFPEAALVILRQSRWEPDATPSYEVMSGGFAWSDERLSQASTACMAEGSWAFQFVMATGRRSSVARHGRIAGPLGISYYRSARRGQDSVPPDPTRRSQRNWIARIAR